jgi:hypothetical protein
VGHATINSHETKRETLEILEILAQYRLNHKVRQDQRVDLSEVQGNSRSVRKYKRGVAALTELH